MLIVLPDLLGYIVELRKPMKGQSSSSRNIYNSDMCSSIFTSTDSRYLRSIIRDSMWGSTRPIAPANDTLRLLLIQQRKKNEI